MANPHCRPDEKASAHAVGPLLIRLLRQEDTAALSDSKPWAAVLDVMKDRDQLPQASTMLVFVPQSTVRQNRPLCHGCCFCHLVSYHGN